MFNFRETKFVPGFHVKEPVDEVPGFRLAPDGSIRQHSGDVPPSTDPSFVSPERWPLAWLTPKSEPANNLAFLGRGLAGAADDLTPQAGQDFVPVAAGDLRCEACPRGGSYGTTGAYRVGGQTLCSQCAVKRLGYGDLPSSELPRALEPYILKAR